MTTLTLTLIRGLPGSGKSTLAKKIKSQAIDTTFHLEADMFFINEKGRYCFQPKSIGNAHKWCEQQCEQYLQQKHNVIVANTFVKKWEMKAYILLAKQYEATLNIKVCRGDYVNIHDVPIETIDKMRLAWQE